MIKPFVEKLLLRAVRNNQETRQRLLVVLAQPDKKPNSLLLVSKLGSLKAYLRDIAEFVEDIGDLLPGLLQECDVPPGIVRLVENTVYDLRESNRALRSLLPDVFTENKSDIKVNPDAVRRFLTFIEREAQILNDLAGALQKFVYKKPSLPQVAEVQHTPYLSTADIQDAYQMSEFYVVLHCYENSVRNFITHVFKENFGEDWWEQAADVALKRKNLTRHNKGVRNRWLTPRNSSPCII